MTNTITTPLALLLLLCAACQESPGASGDVPSDSTAKAPSNPMLPAGAPMAGTAGATSPTTAGAPALQPTMDPPTANPMAPQPTPADASGMDAIDASMPTGDAGTVGSDLVPANPARGDALSDAYAALTRGDRSNIGSVIAAIDQQSAAQPDNAYAVFYAGAFRLWGLSELTDPTTAPGVLDNLERAHAMLPSDFRVTGFYGMSQVVVGGLGDAQLQQDGLQTLAKAVEQESTYGHFLRATAVSTLDPSDPLFQMALSDMQAMGPDCKVQIDANGTYHYPTDMQTVRSRICTNDGIVPHAWEGYFASFGDIALKSGMDAEHARAIYRSAQTAPTYGEWPFKQVLEQRIADAEQAAAAYADANPLNDPTVWALSGNICVGCHQK
jgi:hypothetical protein